MIQNIIGIHILVNGCDQIPFCIIGVDLGDEVTRFRIYRHNKGKINMCCGLLIAGAETEIGQIFVLMQTVKHSVRLHKIVFPVIGRGHGKGYFVFFGLNDIDGKIQFRIKFSALDTSVIGNDGAMHGGVQGVNTGLLRGRYGRSAACKDQADADQPAEQDKKALFLGMHTDREAAMRCWHTS